ncbi:MAG: hypothetical protein L3K23_05165 [Thermoplasmata archaeon]|nr:hypothetical protein [Thermoplasmata archaeon]
MDPLLDGVKVQRDEALEQELRQRSRALEGRGSVWVTDLLDPRGAYFRATHPQPVPAARRKAMELGRQLHARFGRRVAGPSFREVRVHRDGIVGQIDLQENDPAEVKTSSDFPSAADLPELRPSHLEQLAMYCSLVDRPSGHLVLVRSGEADRIEPRAYRVRWGDLAAIRVEMVRRAEVLASAFEHADPTGLPRCAWWARGCEFHAADLCPCRGDEPLLATTALDSIRELREDPEETHRLEERLEGTSSASEEAPSVDRFSDLIYPRRAYFQAVRAGAGDGAPGEPPFVRDDLYAHLSLVIDSGPVGESIRKPPVAPWVQESVACFREVPVLLKVTRARTVPTPETMLRAQPQYFTDLGLRTAAVGGSTAILVLGVARSSELEERLRAYRVDYPDAHAFALRGGERAREVVDCLRGKGDPLELPACPAWMYDRCPYRDACGCAATQVTGASRLQR